MTWPHRPLRRPMASLEKELLHLTKQTASRDFTLLKTTPGIGDYLGLTILHEIGDIARFPSVKIFSVTAAWSKAPSPAPARSRPARGQARQPLSPLGFGEAPSLPNAMRSSARSPNGSKRGWATSSRPNRAGHQAGPGRLFHAQDQNRLRPERLVAALSQN